jgi:DNA replication protein DnaC
MPKDSELIEETTRPCDECKTPYAIEYLDPRRESNVLKDYYCPQCRAILRAAGPCPRFKTCPRCSKRHAIGDDRYYSPWSDHCRACRPQAEEEERQRARQERIEEWPTICPPLYLESDPSRLPKLAEVLKWQYGPQGLLLHGETGKGKTRCAWQLLRRLYVEERIGPAVLFTATSFAHEITENFNAEADPEKWLKRVYGAKVVFFDDFGKCRLTERGESELFGIIEERMAAQLPIIATTNFVGDSLANRMRPDVGSAMVRRLRECCQCIAF